MDVVFVGGGPAGLAGAIELARLVKRDNEAGGGIGELEIGVLEKAGQLGEHNLSGAVVNPSAFRELFPEMSVEDFPFRRPVEKEAVYYLTGSKLGAHPDAADHEEPRQLHRVDLRDGPLDGRAGRGARRERLPRLPRRLAPGRGRQGHRGAHDARRPRS
jgi:flavin-dependent dehydrogenase